LTHSTSTTHSLWKGHESNIILHHKRVHVALVLHPSCVPEKVDLNQEGVNQNVIPIKNNELGGVRGNHTNDILFHTWCVCVCVYIYIHTHTHITCYVIIMLLMLILYRDKQYSL
jgi:hypothetical protein